MHCVIVDVCDLVFGPDQCGPNNKVHFILQHKQADEASWEEKHFNDPPPFAADLITHLYTLEIRQDNTVEIYIDKKSVRKGNLYTHMEPPINPPLMIDDVEDEKPDNWVESSMIPDPTDVEPADWYTGPAMIPDVNARKPETWNETMPSLIPDPAAILPTDWLLDEVIK